MTINSYLTDLASYAILRDDEKASVQRSVAALQDRIANHFGRQVSRQVVFGSYSRGTILPRSMDPESDVDYMVVFSDSGFQPQTYLDRLRRFAETHYGSSEIARAHPAVALDLNHIRFELVPAVGGVLAGLQIPSKSMSYQSWQQTDPTGFNERLIRANRDSGNLIKPLVRLMKYWNASAGHPYESFELEQHIATKGFGFYGFAFSSPLAGYFFEAVDSLPMGIFAPQRKREAVERLKNLARQARSLERAGELGRAEAVMARLLPPVTALAFR